MLVENIPFGKDLSLKSKNMNNSKVKFQDQNNKFDNLDSNIFMSTFEKNVFKKSMGERQILNNQEVKNFIGFPDQNKPNSKKKEIKYDPYSKDLTSKESSIIPSKKKSLQKLLDNASGVELKTKLRNNNSSIDPKTTEDIVQIIKNKSQIKLEDNQANFNSSQKDFYKRNKIINHKNDKNEFNIEVTTNDNHDSSSKKSNNDSSSKKNYHNKFKQTDILGTSKSNGNLSKTIKPPNSDKNSLSKIEYSKKIKIDLDENDLTFKKNKESIRNSIIKDKYDNNKQDTSFEEISKKKVSSEDIKKVFTDKTKILNKSRIRVLAEQHKSKIDSPKLEKSQSKQSISYKPNKINQSKDKNNDTRVLMHAPALDISSNDINNNEYHIDPKKLKIKSRNIKKPELNKSQSTNQFIAKEDNSNPHVQSQNKGKLINQTNLNVHKNQIEQYNNNIEVSQEIKKLKKDTKHTQVDVKKEVKKEAEESKVLLDKSKKKSKELENNSKSSTNLEKNNSISNDNKNKSVEIRNKKLNLIEKDSINSIQLQNSDIKISKPDTPNKHRPRKVKNEFKNEPVNEIQKKSMLNQSESEPIISIKDNLQSHAQIKSEKLNTPIKLVTSNNFKSQDNLKTKFEEIEPVKQVSDLKFNTDNNKTISKTKKQTVPNNTVKIPSNGKLSSNLLIKKSKDQDDKYVPTEKVSKNKIKSKDNSIDDIKDSKSSNPIKNKDTNKINKRKLDDQIDKSEVKNEKNLNKQETQINRNNTETPINRNKSETPINKLKQDTSFDKLKKETPNKTKQEATIKDRKLAKENKNKEISQKSQNSNDINKNESEEKLKQNNVSNPEIISTIKKKDLDSTLKFKSEFNSSAISHSKFENNNSPDLVRNASQKTVSSTKKTLENLQSINSINSEEEIKGEINNLEQNRLFEHNKRIFSALKGNEKDLEEISDLDLSKINLSTQGDKEQINHLIQLKQRAKSPIAQPKFALMKKNSEPNFKGKCKIQQEDGSEQEGELVKGKQEGKGIFRQANGHVYIGNWVNGFQHGQGSLAFKDGTKFKGEFQNGMKHGQGIMVWADKLHRQEGGFYRDKKHGQGQEIFSSNDSQKGNQIMGKREGKGEQKWTNGTEQKGDWHGNLMQGVGVLSWKEGNKKYEGQMMANMRNGWGTFSWGDGSVQTGTFKDDRRHGQGMIVYTDGSTLQGTWDKDRKHGEFVMKGMDNSEKLIWQQNGEELPKGEYNKRVEQNKVGIEFTLGRKQNGNENQ